MRATREESVVVVRFVDDLNWIVECGLWRELDELLELIIIIHCSHMMSHVALSVTD